MSPKCIRNVSQNKNAMYSIPLGYILSGRLIGPVLCSAMPLPSPAHSKCCTSACRRPIQTLEQEAHAEQVELILCAQFVKAEALYNAEYELRFIAEAKAHALAVSLSQAEQQCAWESQEVYALVSLGCNSWACICLPWEVVARHPSDWMHSPRIYCPVPCA